MGSHAQVCFIDSPATSALTYSGGYLKSQGKKIGTIPSVQRERIHRRLDRYLYIAHIFSLCLDICDFSFQEEHLSNSPFGLFTPSESENENENVCCSFFNLSGLFFFFFTWCEWTLTPLVPLITSFLAIRRCGRMLQGERWMFARVCESSWIIQLFVLHRLHAWAGSQNM